MKKTEKRPHILVIGAGFGGLEIAKRLRNKPVRVTLVDKHNYHLFQPLLYQVATGGLEPDNIAYPIRKVFPRAKNISFRMAEVLHINAKDKCVETNIGPFEYDHLVLATGSKSNFFNFDPVQDQLMPLKTVTDALNMRSYILQNFEKAVAHTDGKPDEQWFNIAIVGGGPTGVELAGALAEMKRFVFPKDYPDLDVSRMRVVLYEAAPRLLASMSKESSQKSLDYLKDFGVEVHVDTLVSEYDGALLRTNQGDELKTATVIWTAGVKGEMPGGVTADAIVRGNRIKVDQYSRILGMPEVYAIGDIAYMETEAYPKGHPAVAQPAIQQAKQLAKNLLAWEAGKEAKPFKYKDLGNLATIGRSRAVADLPYWKFQGFFAWLFWMLVHIYTLVGFRNKLATFWGWAYNFFTYDRAMRLIIRPYERPKFEKAEKKEKDLVEV